jgi:UDP-N-acetylmuramoyl-tripeptide--D-alanyl-D-alanine ligase
MKWTLPEMARILHVQSDLPEGPVAGASIDTRTLKPGDLFVALKGEQADGHEFIPNAFQKGAAAALVHSRYECPETGPPLIRVPDTLHAFQSLAAAYRDSFRMRVIGITGSNGKTTTKEMMADVLSKSFTVARSHGNLNNHIGAPLSILNWPDDATLAVVEMGANHSGEIARLCEIARPTHGLITNIGKGHIGYFGSLDGVLAAKSELIDGLSGDRVAFLNGDDPMLSTIQHKANYTILYGFSNECDVRGEDLALDSEGCPAFRLGSQEIHLHIPGRDQASNALAACAVGRYFGVPDVEIKEVLEAYRSYDKRMETDVIHGITFFNDAYNANPSSVEAALRTLAETSSLRRRFAVLGDMLELGDHADAEHRRIGERIAELSLDGFFAYGPLMRTAVQAAQENGVRIAGHFSSHEDIAELLAEEIRPGDGVLLKGSRGMRMERVAILLKQILTQTESE